MSVKMPSDIEELYKEIRSDNKTRFTHSDINNMKSKLFDLEIKYLDNNQLFTMLQHMNSVLDYENNKLNSTKMTIISAITTIFVPLGFITGYFGMNLRSMGNETLNRGILAHKYLNTFILLVTALTIVTFGVAYYVNF